MVGEGEIVFEEGVEEEVEREEEVVLLHVLDDLHNVAGVGGIVDVEGEAEWEVVEVEQEVPDMRRLQRRHSLGRCRGAKGQQSRQRRSYSAVGHRVQQMWRWSVWRSRWGRAREGGG